jgi:hypothetical protein
MIPNSPEYYSLSKDNEMNMGRKQWQALLDACTLHYLRQHTWVYKTEKLTPNINRYLCLHKYFYCHREDYCKLKSASSTVKIK